MTAIATPELDTHDARDTHDAEAGGWTDVCDADLLQPERAVAALVDGEQVAIVLLADGEVYAVGHHDPYAQANVMARGIVGSVLRDGEEIPTLASPMYKQVFDLRDGVALADASVALGAWEVRLVHGRVLVGPQFRGPSAPPTKG